MSLNSRARAKAAAVWHSIAKTRGYAGTYGSDRGTGGAAGKNPSAKAGKICPSAAYFRRLAANRTPGNSTLFGAANTASSRKIEPN